MDEITKVVADLWNFLVYPVILLAVILGVILLIALPEPGWYRRLASTPLAMEWKDEENHKLLETYGITKVAPLAVLFVVVFLLYATRAVVQTTGDLLPGRVTYDPAHVMLHAGDPSTFAAFWATRPGIATPRELGDHLADLADRVRVQDSTSIGANSLRWQEDQARAGERFHATKTILLIATVVLLLRLRVRERRGQRVRNYLGVMACALVAALYFASREVYALEQSGYADLRMVQFTERVDNRSAAVDSATAASRESKRKELAEYLMKPDNRWWAFRWVMFNQPRWLVCTLRAKARLSERC